MYELINTSVPNGLIAGTHGFATVAMTKGMPDVIRTRVESFCAYPHRTSAHDQSYFRDNPVNWFHLQIPSGDHVVGRTAPSEFDYTGRTNRLAHTLVFGAKEMPIVGGAYVLSAESRRFLAGWSGEPKYLPVDKQTAGRLGLADIPRNASPSNWTSVFGEDGTKYARRFAALVAKNVSGGNKCVYFKTSTAWDSDGTRLLGLFTDLINLLPESARPFVTFSTFAACVPNGVTCHLRGVYDKERAFEIASTTQPWVDCEHGRIVHEELLPEEDLIGRDSTDGVNGAKVAEHQPHLGPIRDANQIVSPKQRISVESSASSSASMIKMLLIGGISFVLVIVGVGYWWLNEQQKKQSAIDELLKAAQEDQVKEIEKEKDAPQEKQRESDKSPQREREQKDKAAAKAKDDQAQRKESERLKSERQAGENAARLVAEAKAKEDAAKIAKRCRDEALNKFPTDITKVLKSEEVIDIELKKSEKADLTNDNSIVIWWWDGTKVARGGNAYIGRPKNAMGNQKARVEYKLKKHIEVGSSPWVIFRVPGKWNEEKKNYPEDRVFWQWRDVMQGERRIFNQGDSVDLVQICFGGKNDAYKLWREKYRRVLCGITWRSNSILFWDKEVLTKSAFAEELKNIENDIKQAEDEKKDEEAKRRKCGEPIVNMRKDYIAITNKYYSIVSDKPKKINNKDEEKTEKSRVDSLKEEIKKLVIKYPDICKENQYQYPSVQGYISRMSIKCQGCTCGHDAKIVATGERITRLKAKHDNFYKKIGDRSYKIEVYEDYPRGMTNGINRIKGMGDNK